MDNGSSSEKIKNISATKECIKKQRRRKHIDKDDQEKQPQEEQVSPSSSVSFLLSIHLTVCHACTCILMHMYNCMYTHIFFTVGT